MKKYQNNRYLVLVKNYSQWYGHIVFWVNLSTGYKLDKAMSDFLDLSNEMHFQPNKGLCFLLVKL